MAVNLFENDRGETFLRELSRFKPETVPGQEISYSNAGMIALGIILENVYKVTYSELIEKYITLPFGMNNTETVFLKSEIDNYTTGYDKEGNVMPHITFQIAGAAGGLKSTTYDMINYIRENIIMKDEAIKLSHKSRIVKNGEEIGLGWQIRRDITDDKLLWHDGGEPGFSSYIAIIPNKKVGIICLTNQRGRQNQLAKLSEKIIVELIE